MSKPTPRFALVPGANASTLEIADKGVILKIVEK
jgi:hypothetical protein